MHNKVYTNDITNILVGLLLVFIGGLLIGIGIGGGLLCHL